MLKYLFTTAVVGLLFSLTAQAQLVSDLLHEATDLSVTARTETGKVASVALESSRLSNEFTGIIFQGVSNSNSITAEVRFENNGTFGDWIEARIVRSAADDGSFAGGFRQDDARADSRFQIRFTVDVGASVNIQSAGTFDNRLDDDRSSNGSSFKNDAASGSAGVSAVDPPALITRAEWEANPFIGTPSTLAPNGINYMTFHHAAGFNAENRTEGLAQLRAIQDLHQNVRGWSDIGYQFVIDRAGNVYQGRPFLDGSTTLLEVPALAMGAHVGGANTGNIGVCLLGCYHPSEGSHCTQEITPAAMDAYINLFGFLSESYSVAPTQIRGHRDFSSTACPGDNNYVLLPKLIEDVEDIIVFGNEQPDGFTLEGNYPNPAVGNTTIRYFLEESGIVTIKVFDLAGREVSEIVSEYQEGPRQFSVDYNAGSLASGIYYYQISVDGFGGIVFEDARPLVVVSP